MNKACEASAFFKDKFNNQTISQPAVSKKSNACVFIDTKSGAAHPNELFYESLEGRYGKPIFSTKALILKIRLKLGHFDVWRKVSIPLSINFEELHKVIRICFGWGYSHLHDFIIFDKQKPIARIICDEAGFEEFPHGNPTMLESKVLISEYLPRFKKLIYTYDFGDNWVHFVEVEDILFDFDKNYPACLDGQGDRPPEDIGGEDGYIAFIEIINNPKHEEYKRMKSWADGQYYKGFNIDNVNRQLKYMD